MGYRICTFFRIYFYEEMVEEGHEIGAKLFLILVLAHLAGIFADTIFHRKTGALGFYLHNIQKRTKQMLQKQMLFIKIFSIIWLGVLMILFYLAFGLPVNERGNERENEEEDEWESLPYPDKNSEKSPINLIVKLMKTEAMYTNEFGFSSRQTETNTTVNTEVILSRVMHKTHNITPKNSNDEREYYEHEEHSKHHHIKREHHDYMKYMDELILK